MARAGQCDGRTRLDKRAAWAESIKTTLLLKKLNKQALEELEMSDKAIKVALALLSKTLPDLRAVEHGVDASVKSINITF